MGKNADTPQGDNAAPAVETPAAKVARVVDEWFMEAVANSPVSRETSAWNHMVEAKERLKAKLLTDLI